MFQILHSSSSWNRPGTMRVAFVLAGLAVSCAALAAAGLLPVRAESTAGEELPLSRAPAESTTITVSSTVLGRTTTYIGATEGGGFWTEDLANLGINTYRLWTKMAELEWWDDDDTLDERWDDSEYGSPTIAEIKADAANGFTNTVPWEWWDARFDEAQTWRYGVQSRHGIITALVESGIAPVIVLRTYDNEHQPEQRPGAQWAPRPPVTETFRNEWWEHCFALAYWLNVRHSYGVTHFQVLNEPDYMGQGWQEYGGTQAYYAQLVLDAHDAISYANSLAGLPVTIHAPVVADSSSAYVAYTLDNADQAVQVVDYHDYSLDVRPRIAGLSGTIQAHNTDGVLEPIWNSEWGALWSSYDTITAAMRTANQLLTFSEEGVEGVTVFNMYDWDTSAGGDYGLVDLQGDGQGGALRAYTESYYAYRLVTRGLVGGKERLEHAAAGFSDATRVMVTRDAENVYVIVLRNSVGTTATVAVDLRAIGSGSGEVTVWEYSTGHQDSGVMTPTMSSAQFNLTVPANGIVLARVGRGPLAVQVQELGSEAAAAWPWAVIATLGAGIAILILRQCQIRLRRWGK
jgi:hypothetical protein